MRYRVGCDIGGTFTDFAVLDTQTGEVATHKRLTTPQAPSLAIEEGLRVLATRIPGMVAHADVVHGTTLVINGIIERKGARTALVTTKGFRDALEIGREGRFDQYDIRLRFPKPIVPRPLRFEADERLHVSGQAITPLTQAAIDDVVSQVMASDVEAVAVCLLHSYRNAAHERMIAEAFRARCPTLALSISSEVVPEVGEYERTATTAINAYAQPLTDRYLADLQRRLAGLGFAGDLVVTLSTGGVTSVETARAFPVRIMESGPAAGSVAAAHYARQLDIGRLVSFDMGGTTAKISLIEDGRIAVTDTFEVDRTYRFKRGSGIPVRAPMIDLIEIGAGGGSIARITQARTIQVGPDSVGASPGPACYGAGGTLPTVTDANLVLGYLDPDYFLGGEMRLVRRVAEAAIASIAQPLGLDVVAAAYGIHSVVNENMASAAKVHLAEKGVDPSGCAMFAFGGGGPVHAVDLMRRMGIGWAVIPPRSGVESAFGMAIAPVSYDVSQAFRVALPEIAFDALEAAFAVLEAEAMERLPKSVSRRDVASQRSIDMRYVGQGYQISVALPAGCESDAAALLRLFEVLYRQLYGRVHAGLAVETVSLRVALSCAQDQWPGERVRWADAMPAPRTRLAYSPLTGGMAEYKAFRRDALPAGATFRGLAIVEDIDTSIVIADDSTITVDPTGCLVITASGAAFADKGHGP